MQKLLIHAPISDVFTFIPILICHVTGRLATGREDIIPIKTPGAYSEQHLKKVKENIPNSLFNQKPPS